jgi:hypothetical protein
MREKNGGGQTPIIPTFLTKDYRERYISGAFHFSVSSIRCCLVSFLAALYSWQGAEADKMKVNYWKAITLVLVVVFLLSHSGRLVRAQNSSDSGLQMENIGSVISSIEFQVSNIAIDVHKLASVDSKAPEESENETYHVTQVEDRQLSDSQYSTIGGNVHILGNEVKGFSCVSDVHGNVTCYILSK